MLSSKGMNYKLHFLFNFRKQDTIFFISHTKKLQRFIFNTINYF